MACHWHAYTYTYWVVCIYNYTVYIYKYLYTYILNLIIWFVIFHILKRTWRILINIWYIDTTATADVQIPNQVVGWILLSVSVAAPASGLLLDIILVALKGHKFMFYYEGFIWLLCLDQAMVTWPLCQPHQDRLTSNNPKQAEIAMVVSPWSWKVPALHMFFLVETI